MKFLNPAILFALTACATARPVEPTLNERLLEEQRKKISAGEDVYGEKVGQATSDLTHASLWAQSVGSPYIIRNQKAQKVGDLVTVNIYEETSAESKAKTETKRDSSFDASADLSMGQGTATKLGTLAGSGGLKNDYKGEGTTDRAGKLKANVQAVVEDVLPNGTMFLRGRKVVTVNNEDQEIELTGFVRRDDIKIDNTVASSLIADAKIQYIGKGVVGDKQRVGWGSRLLDFVWPF